MTEEKEITQYEFITHMTKTRGPVVHKKGCQWVSRFEGEWTGYDNLADVPKGILRCRSCMRSTIWKELGFK